MTIHSFSAKLAAGEAGEAFLDRLFATEYGVRPATRAEQRRGIDRWFLDSAGNWLSVEFKTDSRAFQTGNAFVETVSVDTAGKRGWAYTSEAVMLAYYLPDADLVYWLPLARIRAELPRWERDYPHRAVQNDGYQTHGLLVPLDEFERCADLVIETNHVPTDGGL